MERNTLESAAANYSYLRGLLFIPLGMLFVLAALGNMDWPPLRHDGVFVAALVAIGAACVPIIHWYNERYGRVRPSNRQQVRGAIAVAVALVVVVGGSMLLRSGASWSLDLPVNATAVTFALIMLISYGVGIGLKTHHVVIWGALLVAGALPLWNGADPSNIGLLMAGAALMISGLFDHRLFVRTFGAPAVAGVTRSDARA